MIKTHPIPPNRLVIISTNLLLNFAATAPITKEETPNNVKEEKSEKVNSLNSPDLITSASTGDVKPVGCETSQLSEPPRLGPRGFG